MTAFTGKLKIQLKSETPSNITSHSVKQFTIITFTESAQVFAAFLLFYWVAEKHFAVLFVPNIWNELSFLGGVCVYIYI